MRKMKFNHSADTLNAALNVSDERFIELVKAVGHGVVDSVDGGKKSINYEYVYNLFKPVNEEELCLMGFFMGMSESHQELAHSIHSIMEDHGSKHPMGDILRKKPKVHES